MATINEKILACLSDHRTADTALGAIDIARSCGIPVSNVSIYIGGLKKKQGIEIKNTEGRPTRYYLPNGPTRPDKVPLPKRKVLMHDVAMRSLVILEKKAKENGVTLEALIEEKRKAQAAARRKETAKKMEAVKGRIRKVLEKLDIDDRVALLNWMASGYEKEGAGEERRGA